MTGARLFQIAYVTEDLDRGAAALIARFGVAGVGRLGEMTVTTDDGPCFTLNIGIAWLGDLQLEIIEPRGGSDAIFRDALPRDGSVLAMHHLGYLVPSADQVSAIAAEVAASGLPLAFSSRRGEEAAFCYADARRSLGHYLEYLYLSPRRLAIHRGPLPTQ